MSMKAWKPPYVIASAMILALNVVFYALKPGGEALLAVVSDILPVACSLIAFACVFAAVRGFKKFDRTKLAWIFLLACIALDAVAEAAYAWLELARGLDMNEVFPSLADAFWISAYLPLFAFLVLVLRNYLGSGLPLGGKARYVAAVLIIAAIGAAVTALVLVPILGDEGIGALGKAFSAAYPVADILILIPAAILVLITLQFGSGAVVEPWLLITLGFLGWCVSDLLYNVLVWQDLYGSGNFIDLGWNASYLLLGAAGLSQKSLMKSI
jgi:hypothetical protein